MKGGSDVMTDSCAAWSYGGPEGIYTLLFGKVERRCDTDAPYSCMSVQSLKTRPPAVNWSLMIEVGGTSLKQLHFLTAVSGTSATWQRPYLGYCFFILTQWEEAEVLSMYYIVFRMMWSEMITEMFFRRWSRAKKDVFIVLMFKSIYLEWPISEGNSWLWL